MQMKESRPTEGVNNKPDAFVRVILTVIALLLLLLIGQVLLGVEQLSEAETPTPTPTPVEQVSEGCIKAREQAKEALSLPLNAASYEEDVYGEGVSNIYQQMFRAEEYQYATLEQIFLLQQALLGVITECNW